MRLAPELQR